MNQRLRSKSSVPATGLPLRRSSSALISAAILLVGVGAAGCGSSSKSASTSTSTTTITKAAFLAKGNAICIKNNKQTNAGFAKLGKNPTQAQITSYVKTGFVPSIQGAIDGLKALGAPSGDQAKVTSMLNLAQADLNKVKSNVSAFVTGGPHTFANFAKVAHAYGLKACAKKA
jgi:hypothetical protein